MPPTVYILAAAALLIMVLTLLLARKEASLMAGGFVAAFLLLGQFLVLRFAVTDTVDQYQPDWILLVVDAAVSFVVVLAYFTFVAVKSIREHGEEIGAGSPAKDVPAAPGPKAESRTIPLAIPPALFFVMLAVALLATPQEKPLEPWTWGLPDREFWVKVLVFPPGLLGLLGQLVRDARSQLGASIFAGILATWTYVIYLLLFWGMVRSRKWSTLWMLACLLAGILLFNIVGCRLMQQELGLVP